MKLRRNTLTQTPSPTEYSPLTVEFEAWCAATGHEPASETSWDIFERGL